MILEVYRKLKLQSNQFISLINKYSRSGKNGNQRKQFMKLVVRPIRATETGPRGGEGRGFNPTCIHSYELDKLLQSCCNHNMVIWVKVFKNGPRKICVRQLLKNLK